VPSRNSYPPSTGSYYLTRQYPSYRMSGMDLMKLPADQAWDWRAELRRQDRSLLWLARQTSAHRNTVYRYAWGKRAPSGDWLARAAAALNYRRASGMLVQDLHPRTELTLSEPSELSTETDGGPM
jgi:hypothetical protein